MKMKSFAMLALSGLLAVASLAYVAPAVAEDNTGAVQTPSDMNNPGTAAPSDNTGATDNNDQGGASSDMNTNTDNNNDNNNDNTNNDQGSPDTATGDDDY